MKISVVIPTFNNARYLPLAVASVRAQTRPADEIIIVDDGSTDDTTAFVKTLGADIRYLRQPNRGPSAARNRGVAVADCDFIAFLDADDEWLPQALSSLEKAGNAFPNAALIAADMSAIDRDGRQLASAWYEKQGIIDTLAPFSGRPIPDALSRLLRTNFVHTSLVLVRRDLFQELGGFNESIRFAEDLELWTRISARAEVICLTSVLGKRRIHASNSTRKIEPQLQDWIKVAEIIRGWASPLLAGQGASANRIVADAWTSLGYWQFSHERGGDARRSLARSLKERVTVRAGIYFALSCLPPVLIRAGRTLKQAVRL